MTEIKTMNNKDFAVLVYDTAKRVSDINPVFVAAQAALESGWGKAAIGNNLFGITKGSSWTGPTRLVLTTEYFTSPYKKFKEPEKIVTVTQVKDNLWKYKVWRLFRDYKTLEECLRDHLAILQKPHFSDAWPYRKEPIEFVKRLVDDNGPKYATATNYLPVMTSLFNKIEKLVTV